VDRLLRRPLADRRADERAERVLFALVASRALEPLEQAGRDPLGNAPPSLS